MAQAYFVVLFLHSWLRWVALIAGVFATVAAVRRMTFGPSDAPLPFRAALIFVGAMDTQALLGFLLYFVLSPITRAARENFPAAMHDGVLRFWAVEHLTAMVLALVLAHVALVLSRRGQGPVAKARRLAAGFGLAVVLMLAGMPWPQLAYGRELFKGF